MIMYRNPLDKWFWEGGWVYVGGATLLLAVLFFGWMAWSEYQSKQERKKRWLAMNEAQRQSWRNFNIRNYIEAEEWEK